MENNSAVLKYRVVRRLTNGPQAKVSVAKAAGSEHLLVIKVFSAELTAVEGVADAMLATVGHLRALAHPGLISYLKGALLPDGRVYTATQFQEGDSLATVLASGPISVVQLIRLLGPLCDALEYLHSQGLAHGDLRPGHVLLPGGVDACAPRLFDLALPGLPLTESASKSAAPERKAGQPPDAKSDQFSLGVLIFEALAGVALPEGPMVLPEALADLSPVLQRCLDPNPAERFDQVSDVVHALAALRRLPLEPRPVSAPSAFEPSAEAISNPAQPSAPAMSMRSPDQLGTPGSYDWMMAGRGPLEAARTSPGGRELASTDDSAAPSSSPSAEWTRSRPGEEASGHSARGPSLGSGATPLSSFTAAAQSALAPRARPSSGVAAFGATASGLDASGGNASGLAASEVNAPEANESGVAAPEVDASEASALGVSPSGGVASGGVASGGVASAENPLSIENALNEPDGLLNSHSDLAPPAVDPVPLTTKSRSRPTPAPSPRYEPNAPPRAGKHRRTERPDLEDEPVFLKGAPPQRRILLAVGGIFVLAAGALGIYSITSGSEPPPQLPPPTAADTRVAPPAAPPEPVKPVVAAPAQPEPPPKVEAAPALITLEVLSSPSGATVTRLDSGLVLGVTPLRKEIPAGEGQTILRIELAGYRSAEKTARLSANGSFDVTLTKAKSAPKPAPARRSRPKDQEGSDDGTLDPYGP